jgi:hypothetical protein
MQVGNHQVTKAWKPEMKIGWSSLSFDVAKHEQGFTGKQGWPLRLPIPEALTYFSKKNRQKESGGPDPLYATNYNSHWYF